MPFRIPKVYPLTDAAISGLSHAEQVKRLAAGGATIVQLREKNMAAVEFHTEASAAINVARKVGIHLIINDRVDIALAVGADGVHLGQHDLPVQAARSLLGPKAIIGLSTHNLQQAKKALDLPVDYIALGPIFTTRTKANPDPELGLRGLQQVSEVAGDIPLVAIGGITPKNATDVIAAGADSVALISSLLLVPAAISERMADLFSQLN
jgi:thiamine-phosphate pyrophosphorylase